MKLTVENGSFAYSKEAPIIQNLDFSAESGDLIAVLGPNGAGKTTLLRCITGFLKWDEGKSTMDGENIHRMPARKLWQKAAYVPQARGAFASMTAEDMILLGCTSRVGIFSAPGEKERELVHELAEDLGIKGLLDKNCAEISGGEFQMVLIARALAAKPELLILDEPESNLDFRNQLIVLDTMTKLAASGICCIFNTHYPTHALTRASKSLILQKGGETIFGETSKIVTEKNIEDAFGVEAVIGEIETPGNIYQSILPLRVTEKQAITEDKQQNEKKSIAVISIIFSDFSIGTKINELLHRYSDYIIGRMGMPYQEGGVYIINATFDAPLDEISAITHEISILPSVNVKTTIAERGSHEE